VALTSRIQVDILDLDKLIASKKKVYAPDPALILQLPDS
jgi:hypothetical protein